MFKGKVRRFILIPICTVEDENGNPVREEKGKPLIILTGNLPDLKLLATDLESNYDRDYFSKLNTSQTKDRRHSRTRGHSK